MVNSIIELYHYPNNTESNSVWNYLSFRRADRGYWTIKSVWWIKKLITFVPNDVPSLQDQINQVNKKKQVFEKAVMNSLASLGLSLVVHKIYLSVCTRIIFKNRTWQIVCIMKRISIYKIQVKFMWSKSCVLPCTAYLYIYIYFILFT